MLHNYEKDRQYNRDLENPRTKKSNKNKSLRLY